MNTSFLRPATAFVAAIALAACSDASTPTSPLPRASSTLEQDLAPEPGDSWSRVAPMITNRRAAVAATVDDVVYVIGGLIGEDPPAQLRIVEAYDVKANSWTTVAPLPRGADRVLPSGAAAIGGKVYVPGGLFGILPTNTLSIYDPATNSWARGTDMPFATSQGISAAIAGKLYVLTPGDLFNGHQPRLDRYDPVTNSWTERATPPNSHLGGVGGVIGGKLYVATGSGVSGPTTRLDVYDPHTDTWGSRRPIPTARQFAGGAALNGKLYVVGGMLAGLVKTRRLEVYDPRSDEWSSGANMPTPRALFAAAVANGQLFAMGGETNDDIQLTVTTNEAYTPSRGRKPTATALGG